MVFAIVFAGLWIFMLLWEIELLEAIVSENLPEYIFRKQRY